MFMQRDNSGSTSTTWLSPKSPDVGDRYVVLYDKRRACNQPYLNTMLNTDADPDAPARNTQSYLEHFKINLRGRATVYNGAQEITEGALYVIVIALTHITGDPYLNVIGMGYNCCRLRYYDS